MANKKISELTSVTLPLAGTEEIPIVQSGVTKKVAVSEFDGIYESLSNKSTSTSLGTSNTLYPTQNAVKVYADTKLDRVTTDYTDATTPLAGTEIALVEQGGTFKKVAVSEFGGGGDDTFTLTFHTGSKTWVINTWYQQFSGSGFNISGTTTYGTGSVPTSTVHANGSWLQIPAGFIIEKVTFGVQSIGSALSGTAYRNEVYITRGEVTAEQTDNSQTSLEVLCQQSIDFTGNASNPKFLKDLTIASHSSKALSILQVVMREMLVNNANYNVLMNITFKKV